MSVGFRKNRFGSGCNCFLYHLRRGRVAVFVIEFNIVKFLTPSLKRKAIFYVKIIQFLTYEQMFGIIILAKLKCDFISLRI